MSPACSSVNYLQRLLTSCRLAPAAIHRMREVRCGVYEYSGVFHVIESKCPFCESSGLGPRRCGWVGSNCGWVGLGASTSEASTSREIRRQRRREAFSRGEKTFGVAASSVLYTSVYRGKRHYTCRIRRNHTGFIHTNNQSEDRTCEGQDERVTITPSEHGITPHHV